MNNLTKTLLATLLPVISGSALANSVPVPVQTPSSPEVIQSVLSGGISGDRWTEGLMYEGVAPMPWLKSAANWYPGTEEVQPEEMRVTFMGTSPMIRPGQMNTSIYVELGNGDNFVFDIGEGSVANYVAAGVALNEIKHVFLTHLHVDHFGGLPYLWMFGTWNGGWHDPLTVHGPSGSEPQYGTQAMVNGMTDMVAWHKDSFSLFPVGSGHDLQVNEFDFRNNGGVIYDENGVTVTHWQRSHGKDGSSAYRLDWNDMCFTWTGDGRPTELDIKYAEGCDLFITELQTELVEIGSAVQGVPPFLTRYTIDTHHTPAYGAGYLANEIQPRMFMTTHMSYDPYQIEETVAEVREHWEGPYHFGAPDGIVVNMTKDSVWVREGILPEYPNSKPPQFDFTNGQLVIPEPPRKQVDIQESFIREQHIDPAKYYPEGMMPDMILEWPVDGDLVVPEEMLPETLRKSMGANWDLQQKRNEYFENKANKETK
ncbi:guanitoxin biosynthesis MBL fold metallo-hydrolase GntH [Vibrio neonatus]|uniref:guanitoxin biosynthesis MBL fold metallo-hydrolase GntH n=1 Tax=Vibrio neonatus TaxID=278860 RepID=UPI0021C3BAAE|nr:guanitoxin biosynthesis MBL fold metallo-hydrolase GntH [Vibrio neonatus]